MASLLAGIAPVQPVDLGASFRSGQTAAMDMQRQGLQLQQEQQDGAKRTAEIIGRFAVDADTPEKWASAMQTAAQLGVPDASEYAGQFDKRDQIIRATQAVSDQLNTRTAGQFTGYLQGQQGRGVLGTLPMPGPAPAGAAPPVGTVATKPVAPMSTAQPSNYGATNSGAPASLVGSAGTDTLRPTLARSESGGNPSVVNAQGYSGTYQMGEGALQTAGLYNDPTPGVKNDWQGSFSIPGHPEVRTHEDFLKSPQAQDAAFDVYKADLERQMNGLGLGQYIGQTVGGVPITEDGLIMMAHLGGVTGARKFLETGGQYDPSDSNGTHLSDYARRAAGGGGAVRPATRDIQAPVPNGVPMEALGILAQNPTYAGTAINTAIAQYGAPKDTTVWARLDDGRIFNQRTGDVVEAPGAPQGGVALSAEQAKALGFAPGTVVQRKKDGTLDVLQKPSESGLGGPYQGNAIDAQDSNVLLNGDPSSPQYAMAYQRQYQLPRLIPVPDPNTPGGTMMSSVIIQPPAQIRPPTGGVPAAAPQQNSALGTPQASAPSPAATPSAPGQMTLQPIPGTSKPLVPTEQQRLDASFATRMAAANQTLDQFSTAGADLGQRAKAGVPVIGNYLVSPEYQQFDQAKRDFVNAQLRRESGAAISQSEFDNAEKQYFPQPGDGPEVIEQKRQARQRSVENMRVQSGPAARASEAPAASSTPTINNDAEYDALPSGQEFIAPDGSHRKKP